MKKVMELLEAAGLFVVIMIEDAIDGFAQHVPYRELAAKNRELERQNRELRVSLAETVSEMEEAIGEQHGG